MASTTVAKRRQDRESAVLEGRSVSMDVRDIYKILANTMVRDLTTSLKVVDQELRKRNIDYLILNDQRHLRILKEFFRIRGIPRDSYYFHRGSQGTFLFLSLR